MRKVKNWTYERGMQRLAWWKEEDLKLRQVKVLTAFTALEMVNILAQ